MRGSAERTRRFFRGHCGVENYAQALFNSDNATIALYRPHLRQSDIYECRGREDLVDVMQPVMRNMVFKDCLSAAASRNQGQ